MTHQYHRILNGKMLNNMKNILNAKRCIERLINVIRITTKVPDKRLRKKDKYKTFFNPMPNIIVN